MELAEARIASIGITLQLDRPTRGGQLSITTESGWASIGSAPRLAARGSAAIREVDRASRRMPASRARSPLGLTCLVRAPYGGGPCARPLPARAAAVERDLDSGAGVRRRRRRELLTRSSWA